MMTADRMLGLLGKPVDSAETQLVFAEIGLPPDDSFPPQRKSRAASVPALGLAARWEPASMQREGYTDAPADTRVVCAVFFYAPGHENHVGFAGDLPHGLRFDQSREEVRALLGPPPMGSSKYPNDRWTFDRYDLTVDFRADGDAIVLVTAFLPWAPRQK
jgi:hypothetical protein